MIDLLVIVTLTVVLIFIYRLTKPKGDGCHGCSGHCHACQTNIYEQYRKDHPYVVIRHL
ncbi:hypothetical protein [Merdibacter massiliensis]|uniref:hypothetical protein n=1 Tax=Merdibacter massiliensis TaxID=1871030 RepID=UPI0012B5ADE1|nr:hypothetical protein [Merdibacter massiliensis]